MRTAVRESQAFLGRAVRYLAQEAGITQFLDVGSGLPSVGNVHETKPSARHGQWGPVRRLATQFRQLPAAEWRDYETRGRRGRSLRELA
jgi:hypothetical protein